MERYTFAILVRNQFGVLNRVTSMFRRRQFNISSLTVSETESADLSRITVLFDGDEQAKQQLKSQLYKLPDIKVVSELDRESTVNCELLLIKLANSSAVARNDILDAAGAFDAKVMDYTRDAIILQLVGESRHIDNFIDLMRDYEILEICRTGVVSLQRGSAVMRNVTRL
ncbi:MAG: acetolactate synthase small subunit [Atopobiaceae bacterium]|nr:acetolactate synthase small subunit [Atopobiaceae bacterium]MBR3315985.1 acetolactate synthase small subunit [Atopobiaceae bacterium]